MTMATHLLFTWLVAVLMLHQVQADVGTTTALREIFIGRCYDYKMTHTADVTGLPKVEASCANLWINFSSAFVFREACGFAEMTYASYLAMARQELPTDKSLFWSGVFGFVQEFSDEGKRYVTLEDTLLAYLPDSLVWCGQPGEPGLNYTGCPDWKSCPGEARGVFWTAASTLFAEGAKGEVTVMLTGSIPGRPAYKNDSLFGVVELPSLQQGKVTKVKVMLTHELDKPRLETCLTGSLVELKKDVEERGFVYECEDDPPSVMYLMCSKSPDSNDCQAFAEALNSATVTGTSLWRSFIVVISLLWARKYL